MMTNFKAFQQHNNTSEYSQAGPPSAIRLRFQLCRTRIAQALILPRNDWRPAPPLYTEVASS